MRNNLGYLVPGEAICERKPWLRRVDNDVIRYVRPSVEDSHVEFTRAINEDLFVRAALERKKDQLDDDLDFLRCLGVPVVASSTKVKDVPLFNRQGDVSKVSIGLEVTSQFVDGTRLDLYLSSMDANDRGAVTQPLSCSLREYVEIKMDAGEPFLGDIFTPHQYIASQTPENGVVSPVLADIDPIFAQPTIKNYQTSIALIELFGHN